MNFNVPNLLFSIALASSLVMTTNEAKAEAGCVDSGVIGAKLITDICWDCLFPIVVAGVEISDGGVKPAEAAAGGVCACADDLGVPRPGVTTSFWEPSRMIEFQRIPGCLSALNGAMAPVDRLMQGKHRQDDMDGSDVFFLHYHYYAFPLLTMLEMFTKMECNNGGYMDFDIMFISELDATWNDPDLAFFGSPEAAAVITPAANLACVTDAIASNIGEPIDSMFWCAGSWGNMYPLGGYEGDLENVIAQSSLMTARVLSKLHRRGQAMMTMGEEAMCGGVIEPILPKSMYKLTLLYPIPEKEEGHVIGESILNWGNAKTIPAIGQDPIYTIWQWNDCCNSSAN